MTTINNEHRPISESLRKQALILRKFTQMLEKYPSEQSLCRRRNEIFEEIIREISQDEYLCNRRNALMRMGGIGIRRATFLVLELPQLGYWNHKQINSYVGLPLSSTSNVKRRSRRLKYIRRTLQAIVPNLIEHNMVFRLYWLRLQETKPVELVRGACMRKLLAQCNDILHRNIL